MAFAFVILALLVLPAIAIESMARRFSRQVLIATMTFAGIFLAILVLGTTFAVCTGNLPFTVALLFLAKPLFMGAAICVGVVIGALVGLTRNNQKS
jgi:hypothetical protein